MLCLSCYRIKRRTQEPSFGKAFYASIASMTFRKLIIAITFLSIFAMAARISVDTDSWWHLRTGQWISENQSVPKEDSFSYTRSGESWLYPSAAWISQWTMHNLYQLAGPAALNIGLAFVVTLTYAFMYFTLKGGPFLRAGILLLSAATASVFWSARPQMSTFLFFALFLYFLESYRWKRIKHLYWLPLLMLFWTNSHPGFAAGYILLFIYFLDASLALLVKDKAFGFKEIGRKLRHSDVSHFIIIAILLLLASSINPSGPRILLYPFETLSIGILRDFIQEWQSPNFHDLAMQPFLWSLLLIIALLGFSKRRIVLSDFLLISVFAYMALMAGRNIALFALAAAPAMSRHGQDVSSRIARKFNFRLRMDRPPTGIQKYLNVAILLIVILLVLVKSSLVIDRDRNTDYFAEGLPLEAVQYLSVNRPQGNLFNSYNWGGYLIWALPQYPVFVDGRTDLYSDTLLSEWLSIVAAEDGWERKLEYWNVRLLLLEDRWPLVSTLDSEGWNLLIKTDTGLLFEKNSGEGNENDNSG